MKQTITAILILISVMGFAQPKKQTEFNEGVTIKFKSITDTLSGNIISYDKEGYLQRKSGKVIRKISVFENALIIIVVITVFVADRQMIIYPMD